MSDLENASGHFLKIRRQLSDKFSNSYQILDIWNELVGEQLSKNTSAEKFIKGILYVSVFSNAWLNHTNFLKNEIINKYNKHFNRELVKDIKFFLRKNNNSNLSNNTNFLNKEYKKTLYLEILSDEEEKYIDNSLNSIEDRELREKLKKIFLISRRKEITLIKNGWKKCKKCNYLFNEKEDICKLCRKKI